MGLKGKMGDREINRNRTETVQLSDGVAETSNCVLQNFFVSVHVIFSDRKPSPVSPTAFIKNETTKNPFSILKKN